MSAKTDLKALDTLLASRGWALVNDVMREEIVQAAMLIAENPTMSEKEVDYRRGAIWAAKQLLELPTRLRARIESTVILESASRSATAEPTKE